MTLSWLSILRLGLVQMALGSVVVLTTATMNRVMVVELAFPAMLPGILVGIYYATQFLRPRFGHGADQGQRRTSWIVGGIVLLAIGGSCASLSVALMGQSGWLGIAAAIPSFVLIGLGIGAAGTNLLALLAARVAPERKAAAGSAVWIMMVAGLATTGITVGQLLDPYTPARLVTITVVVGLIAITLSLIGVWGIEREPAAAQRPTSKIAFRDALTEVWSDPAARGFAIFVFASMFAYNTQDLILEPYAGHVFAMTPGESTALGGQHHAGALMGMLAVLVSATALRRWISIPVRAWIIGGCLASGAALIALGIGGQNPDTWPIALNVFLLGFSNGSFAVAAIGAMMGLASEGRCPQEGVRMGLFGAAQAIAFGLGSLTGTILVDITRALMSTDAGAYGAVFMMEGLLFVASAIFAFRLSFREKPAHVAMVPGE